MVARQITRLATQMLRLELADQTRSFALGDKLHLSIDHKTMLPLSIVFASANQNKKKHSLTLLEKAKMVLKSCEAKVRSLVADSQYSDSKLRSAVEKAIIPDPANHMKEVVGFLRVDRKFSVRRYIQQERSNAKNNEYLFVKEDGSQMPTHALARALS